MSVLIIYVVAQIDPMYLHTRGQAINIKLWKLPYTGGCKSNVSPEIWPYCIWSRLFHLYEAL